MLNIWKSLAVRDLSISGLALAAIVANAAPKASLVENSSITPNPYLAFLRADQTADYRHWGKKIKQRSVQRRLTITQYASAFSTQMLDLESNNANLTVDRAQTVSHFGTGAEQSDKLAISGAFDLRVAPQVIERDSDSLGGEDDGDIVRAHDIPLPTTELSYQYRGHIGDGPFGSAGTGSGDFDVYRLRDVPADTALSIAANATDDNLDTYIEFLDHNGNVLFENDDFTTTNSFLIATVTEPGTYYVLVRSFESELTDKRDSSSGVPGLRASEGGYELALSLQQPLKRQYFQFQLNAGDLIEASVLGGAEAVALHNGNNELLMALPDTLTGLYPSSSPLGKLPGRSQVAYVIPNDGRYYLTYAESDAGGEYTGNVHVYRPFYEARRIADQHQVIFVDFDGATINARDIFAEESASENAEMSPLADFLPNWGLTESDENAVIDAILATLNAQLAEHLASHGNNDHHRVTILNSRDHNDTFGADPNVSRLIIGGTVAEVGIDTVGIAESIDLGNYATAETGIILLDTLSADPETARGDSINFYRTSGPEDKISLIGRMVGTIASHEAGHFLGNFHTDQFNNQVNVMDQGGNLRQLASVDATGLYIRGLQPLPRFTTDVYVGNEGIQGMEDSLNTTAFALTRYQAPPVDPDPVNPDPVTPDPTDNSAGQNSSGGGSSGGAVLWLLLMLPLLKRRFG